MLKAKVSDQQQQWLDKEQNPDIWLGNSEEKVCVRQR